MLRSGLRNVAATRYVTPLREGGSLPGLVEADDDGIGRQALPAEAAVLHWLDAFSANIDRTWRNPNLLVWHRQLWAIDHGAALIFQHAWPPVEVWATKPYDLSQHVLGPVVATLDRPALAEVDARAAATLTDDVLAEVLALVPDGWLLAMNAAKASAADAALTAADWRARYVRYLAARRDSDRTWWRP